MTADIEFRGISPVAAMADYIEFQHLQLRAIANVYSIPGYILSPSQVTERALIVYEDQLVLGELLKLTESSDPVIDKCR